MESIPLLALSGLESALCESARNHSPLHRYLPISFSKLIKHISVSFAYICSITMLETLKIYSVVGVALTCKMRSLLTFSTIVILAAGSSALTAYRRESSLCDVFYAGTGQSSSPSASNYMLGTHTGEGEFESRVYSISLSWN